MNKVFRHRYTLDEAMQKLGAAWIGPDRPVAFDPSVCHQYHIRRGSTHDGTYSFTLELLGKTLLPVLLQASYYLPNGPAPDGMRPHYTVGYIRYYGVTRDKVNLPCGKYPGVIERFSMPVRCEFRPIASPEDRG